MLSQLQEEAVLLHQNPVVYSGPVPAHVERKLGQLDDEIGLVLLSQPLGDDSGAGLGLGLLVGGGEVLATTRGHLFARRVPELPLVDEEVGLGHHQPVVNVLGHELHQPRGNALDLEPLQLLTDGPGPERR